MNSRFYYDFVKDIKKVFNKERFEVTFDVDPFRLDDILIQADFERARVEAIVAFEVGSRTVGTFNGNIEKELTFGKPKFLDWFLQREYKETVKIPYEIKAKEMMKIPDGEISKNNQCFYYIDFENFMKG